jgi:hypothetical protein
MGRSEQRNFAEVREEAVTMSHTRKLSVMCAKATRQSIVKPGTKIRGNDS